MSIKNEVSSEMTFRFHMFISEQQPVQQQGDISDLNIIINWSGQWECLAAALGTMRPILVT